MKENDCSKCPYYYWEKDYWGECDEYCLINCDICGSLLEVDPYHYFKDNTTIYYCYNCEVWTY